LEHRVGGRITSIIPPSIAETRGVPTIETHDGSARNGRAPSPNTVARKMSEATGMNPIRRVVKGAEQ
jgi:hypothetical protein